MCPRVLRIVLILVLFLGASSFVRAQNAPAFACTANGITHLIRAEGEAEQIGDLILNCTGGAPTGAGQVVPSANITLYFNTNETSHLTAASVSEALLLIDEPHSGRSSSPALFPCGATGSNDNGSGVCSITSDGTPTDTYNGSAGHPNAFQAQPSGVNSLSWNNVPLDPPGVGATRILRFTNMRVAASLLGAGPASSVVAFIQVNGSVQVAVNNPQQTAGFLQTALTNSKSTPATLSQCLEANPGIAASSGGPLDLGGQNGAQFSISLTEQFASAFKVKNYAETETNTGPPFLTLYPTDVDQDVPGYPYNNETGFFDGSTLDSGIWGIAPAAEFPATHGLNTVGAASSGTRVYLQFNVPEGVQLYVPATIPLVGSGTVGETGVAVLTATDANGAGAFAAIKGNSSGLAPVTIANSSGMAVYEILQASPNVIDTLTIPVAAAFLANQPTPGVINAQYGLAPLSASLPITNATSPQPRFANTGASALGFTIKSCSGAAPPFGSFDTPAATSTGNGAMGFTGWALGAAGITNVDIWREPNPGESTGLVFIGDADFVPGARPDVHAAFPNYPGSNAAGWGFQILTNELPSNGAHSGLGTGTYRIHGIAHDANGGSTDLGVKTLTTSNATATQPFGTIDTPSQGGVVSGTDYVNFGWALTPVGKAIPTDGSTIKVLIDKISQGHPVYNQYRSDIAATFPGYANSGGAVGYFRIDTTKLTNGLHTISWVVTDSAGAASGIGSRFFIVQN